MGIALAIALVIPWAWERPEDLRGRGAATIAYYAGIIDLRGGRVDVTPRMNPLRVDPRARLIAVVRIETHRPVFTDAQREQTVKAILRLAGDAPELQIDFDAAVSERAFYRDVLVALRARTKVPLSMTALASWCMGDRWLASLPVDEVVPMLFDMGRDEHAIRVHVSQGRPLRDPRCRDALGVATDEPFPRLPPARRVYVFNPNGWSR